MSVNGEWYDVTVAGPSVRLEELMDKAPSESIALLTMTGEKVTYAELQQASCLVAVQVRRLLQMPLPCGLFTEKSEEMLFGMIGILKAGSAYVPMPSTFPVDRLCYIVCDSGLGAVVTTSQLLPKLDRIANGVPVVNLSEVTRPTGTLALPNLKRDVPLSADDTFVLFYTSGSTGKPKGSDIISTTYG